MRPLLVIPLAVLVILPGATVALTQDQKEFLTGVMETNLALIATGEMRRKRWRRTPLGPSASRSPNIMESLTIPPWPCRCRSARSPPAVPTPIRSGLPPITARSAPSQKHDSRAGRTSPDRRGSAGVTGRWWHSSCSRRSRRATTKPYLRLILPG